MRIIKNMDTQTLMGGDKVEYNGKHYRLYRKTDGRLPIVESLQTNQFYEFTANELVEIAIKAGIDE